MTRTHTFRAGRITLACGFLFLAGCQSAYYSAMEQLGFEKRDILVDRVGDAREAQQDAREQFESALEQFIAVTGFEGGDLEARYRALSGEYEDSLERAEEVRERIAGVERVAQDLFAEWAEELGEYSNAEYRRVSKRQLTETRARYEKLMAAMKRAESRLQPVLTAYYDRVLFLKHNLNAQAIASLRGERDQVQADITALIEDMNRAIREADAFIEEMQPS